MIKLAAFSVSEAEKPYFEKAKEKYGVEFVLETAKELNLKEAQNLPQDVDGVLVMPKSQTTKEIIDVLNEKNVKSLATRSAGLDAIDVEAAKAVGIAVTNVAAYSPQAIAEFAVMLILSSLRKIHELTLNMQEGNFEGLPLVTHQLDSRVIGIVGYGYIGQSVAKLLHTFGPKIVVYTVEDIAPDLLLPNMEVEKDFKAFLAKVNVLTLHCPFTPETKHLINEETIQYMNPEMVLINTARGPIVNAKAVLTALEEGRMTFYATDVYEFEQNVFHQRFENVAAIPDNLFKKMLASKKVFVTPHIAFNTYTSVQNMVYYSIDNTLSVLNKK